MNSTAEQREIIHFTSGHGLVFAVAGSGKTTSMIERILHLIRQEQVRPVRILACTFSREAARTIEVRLAHHPETIGVKVATLHALASTIIMEAARMGFTELRRGEDNFFRRIFQQARDQLIAEDLNEKSAFYNIKYDDFQTYMSIQKGALHLPYVPDDLPEWGRERIGAPDRGVELYADLYHRHDALRRTEGKIDFDDYIVEAWMLMARFSSLREAMRNRWDYVHVDEFQDVNLAQSEMMDLLASGCKSYLAIGDDDQTVYQWRGADPRFILGFADRYDAREFTLSTNFGCPMGVIALADQVIQHNTVRAPKRLRASRSGNGVHLHEHKPGQAAHVAIQAIEEGRSPTEIVILVRTYAQTGDIEQVFLDREVPYLIVGGVPFYQRQEVGVLLAYLRLALADLDTQREVPISAERRLQLTKDWKLAANTPNRYLRAQTVSDLGRSLWRKGRTLAVALAELAPTLWSGSQRDLLVLNQALDNLTDNLGLTQGKEALLDFAQAIGYTDHLIRTAPTREFGEERAGSVRALAEMAAERSLGELVTYISQLGAQGRHVERLSDAQDDKLPRVTIMTAFRAKGLEWPVVIVPDCKAGLYRIRETADIAAAEEERRVFYVALTRAQKELHLVVDSAEPTEFLTKVNHEQLVHGHTRLAQLMAREPASWSARDTLEATSLLTTYGHEQFVQLWLDGGYRRKLLHRIGALGTALTDYGPVYHGRAETVQALSLDSYRLYGDVSFEQDGEAPTFADLDQLVRELHLQYTPTAPAQAQVSTVGRSTGTALRPEDIKVDLPVYHSKFGNGTILSVKGVGNKTEVELRFSGLETTKRMLVVYANLQRARLVAISPTPPDPWLDLTASPLALRPASLTEPWEGVLEEADLPF